MEYGTCLYLQYQLFEVNDLTQSFMLTCLQAMLCWLVLQCVHWLAERYAVLWNLACHCARSRLRLRATILTPRAFTGT